ncbi:zinc ribbon domain-containing protein [Clostridium sp. 'White wine YQ']|uniref:zinc ribbon domain-containing protein n=1 Tax=Clostridium sp. 'White wine YQ' TaxID=3027474 RepID=UPI00236507E8|nr:zinc ribbon domain-containing protein [Clostridium sp. 'White wine YQ']MDD7794502.1 zinc-ribbon domain-containing protein [Clostridium sp. 'White wine YQ']
MYCRNCGKEILENDKFCPECGTKNEAGAIQNQSSNIPNVTQVTKSVLDSINLSKDKSVDFYITLGSSVIMIFLMFGGWVKASFLGLQSNSFSLYRIFSLASQFKNFDSHNSFVSAFNFFAFLFFVGAILGSLLLCVYCYKLIKDFKSSLLWGNRAMITVSLLSAGFVIVIMIVNSSLKSESYGLVSNLLSFTATPFIVLVGGLANKFYFLKKLESEIPH